MLYLGIDQSLNSTGVALYAPLVDKPVELTVIQPAGLRDGPRLALIRSQLARILEGRRITQAAMEAYSYGSVGKVFELGEVGGVIKCLLAELKVPLVTAAPTQLKKFVAKNSSADKAQMSAATKVKWGLTIVQDDMCDAYGLARLAAVYDSGLSSFREELEVVQSMKKPGTATTLKPRFGRRKIGL